MIGIDNNRLIDLGEKGPTNIPQSERTLKLQSNQT